MDGTSSLLNLSEETFHIALCVNDSWADYVAPVLYGLSHHHPHRKIQVHLVYRQVAPEKLAHLQSVSDCLDNLELDLCYLPEGLIDSISVADYYLPLETYFRLLLPELLPQVDRVIYLDVDVMVAGQLDDLWSMDLKDSCIAAAQDLDVHTILSAHLDRIGYGPGDTYFNAGVLLLDLEKMRQRDLSTILIAKAGEWADRLHYGDQDLLNFYFKEEVVYFSGAYNFQSARIQAYQEGDQVAIVHFNGSQKPWLDLLDLDQSVRPFAGQYQAYQARLAALLSPNQEEVTLVVDATRGSDHLRQCLSSLGRQTHNRLHLVVVCRAQDEAGRQLVTSLQPYRDNLDLILAPKGLDRSLLLEQVLGSQATFVSLVDAKDYLEPGFVAALLEQAQTRGADLVISAHYGLNMASGHYYFPVANELTSQELTAKEGLESLSHPIFQGLEGKLYRRQFLAEVLSLAEGTGLGLMSRLYLASRKTVYLKGTYFCHRTHLPLGEMAEQLSYWTQSIEESQACLAQLSLADVDRGWLQDRLREEITQALSLCGADQAVLTHYLQETLTLLTKE